MSTFAKTGPKNGHETVTLTRIGAQMARIRTIKPSFWSDAGVAGLSRDARLLLVGLISSADDEGRFLASTAAVAGYVYPHDNISPTRLRGWLDEIETAGLVRFYSVSRREYGAFPNWRKHQVINRPQPSTLPEPPALRAV
jgi:DNA replication protein DnaT